MGLVAGQPVAAAELDDPLAQELLGPLQLFLLVAALGKSEEKLFHERRHRRTALRGDNPSVTIGLAIE
jgi:hypothetical protein